MSSSRFITLVFLVILSSNSYSATCSCAGVPLTGSMNQTGLNENTWQLKLTYDFHDISDLVQGSTEINDETGRERETNSYILQLSYGINDNWTVSAVTSYIDHYRKINNSQSGAETSTGLGDTLIAGIYTPYKITPFSRYELALGLAKKLSSGKSNNQNNGIVFIEDMQPGTGASSNTAWLYGAYAFSQAAENIIYSSINYTQNKENDRTYRFGNEVNFTIGYNHQSESIWAYGVSLNYRNASAHKRLGFDVPNTGGNWVNIAPLVQYNLSETLAAQASLSIPIKRDLKGALQFTTQSSLSLGVSYQW